MTAQPKKLSGLSSLYDDLLEPEAKKTGTTISSAPVKYDTQQSGSASDEGAQQKKKDASLKFQPIKRPQVPQKPKPKASSSSSSAHKFSSSNVTAATASSPDKQQALPSSTPSHQPPGVQKSNFADWVGDEEDDFFYQDSRARGGRKRKNKKNKTQERTWDWDDIYDPTLPNNYADYKGSEEQTREIRDWKARLYYHQLKEAKKGGSNGAGYSDEENKQAKPKNMMFAPPTTMSFAPPSFDDAPSRPPVDDYDEEYYPPAGDAQPAPKAYDNTPSFAPASVFNDATGDEAYARRMQMHAIPGSSPPVPAIATPPPPPPPPPPVQQTDADMAAKRAIAQAKIEEIKAKMKKQSPHPSSTSAVPPPPPPVEAPAVDTTVASPPPLSSVDSGLTISRAPVRYEAPPPPTEMSAADAPMTDADSNDSNDNQPRSKRPGQKGFAQRLMQKYGWEKGHGLGVQGDGITTALFAKADNQKKRQHDPNRPRGAPLPAMGKIVGGKKRKIDGDASADAETTDPRYGKMSEVVKLESMLNGLDVQHEIEENNLMQEIGEHMGTAYGNVERVFIWREAVGGTNEVFVKFTSPLSALNAVNGMTGTEFAGNEVKARFWEVERFERGEYA